MAGDSMWVSSGNMLEIRCQVIACQRSGDSIASRCRY